MLRQLCQWKGVEIIPSLALRKEYYFWRAPPEWAELGRDLHFWHGHGPKYAGDPIFSCIFPANAIK